MEAGSCPRCGKARIPGARECPGCGVIFDRWRPRPGDAATYAGPVPGAVGDGAPSPDLRARFEAIAAERGGPAPEANPAPVRTRLRPARLERLLLSLAQALESGLSLPVLAGGPAVAALPARLRERLRTGLVAGEPLSSLLAGLLDPPATALLRAAEERGGTPAALRVVAARIAERRKDRLKLLLALVHPATVALAAAIFLPLPTLFRGDVVGYLARSLPLAGAVAAVTVGLLLAGVVLPPGSPLDRFLAWFALWFPPTRAIRLRSSLATFASLLADALRAGLPVRAAAPLAASAVDHPAVVEAGRAVPARLDAGETLTAALSALPGLAPDALALLDAGERTGRLPESLAHVAREARSQARLFSLILLGAISTAIGLLVAGFVVYAVISAWTDYFQGTDRFLGRVR
jgi:general secretion pathway protein F